MRLLPARNSVQLRLGLGVGSRCGLGVGLALLCDLGLCRSGGCQILGRGRLFLDDGDVSDGPVLIGKELDGAGVRKVGDVDETVELEAGDVDVEVARDIAGKRTRSRPPRMTCSRMPPWVLTPHGDGRRAGSAQRRAWPYPSRCA